jgi:arsenate reductase
MAEAFFKTLFPERFEAYSAGTQPEKLNPFVVKAMGEVGMDISGNRAKSVDEFKGNKFDLVVTVCDQAKETCPYFPGAKDYLHRNFEDPSTFSGSEEEIMEKVRQVRDNIKEWVLETFGKYT